MQKLLEIFKSMKNLTDQQGSLLAFVAVMFITPDSYLSDFQILILGALFFIGVIPFATVFGMLVIYKLNFFKLLFQVVIMV